MADVVEQVVNATLNATAENATETLSGAKKPATPEGAAVAYGSLIVMAMLPIFFGALRSVKHQKDQKVNDHMQHFIQKIGIVISFSRVGL